jgi:ribosome-associated protein
MSLDVTVREEPTELYKILKIAGLVASGGEAKFVVSEGKVRVNGAVETQKRKKIMVGDLIEFGGETLRVRLKQG